MEKQKKGNWFSTLLITLIAVNVLTLGVLWFLKIRQETAPDTAGRNAAEFITRELALSKMQQQQYQVLVEQHRTAMQQLRKQIGPLKDQFFGAVKDSSLTNTEVKRMAAQIAEKEMEIDLLTFNHFRDLRKLCTPAQQVKFDKIISQVMHMIAPPPGNMQGPPPPRGENGLPPPRGENAMPPPPGDRFGGPPPPPPGAE